MATVDLKNAFNAVADGEYIATRATLGYERAHDTEWQVITFYGRKRDGSPFEAASARLRPDTDLIGAARDTAQAMLDQDKAKTPALPPPDGA